MLKSMTGFGYGEYCDEIYKINVEAKSVNHRYRDTSIHMPKRFNQLEDEIRNTVSASLMRGKIDVFVSVEECGSRTKKIRVDKDLVIAYYNALSEISTILKVSPPDNVNDIAKYADVLIADEETFDMEMFKSHLMLAVQAAIHRITEMRAREGESIFADLTARINNLDICVDAIRQRSLLIAGEYQARLAAKVSALLAGTAMDETRLLQEIILFTEKTDYTEELVRLESHMRQFRASMGSIEGPVGRKLDFIVQEMNREINTIASKANDAEVAGLVVESKSELEKIREQIQNIE